MRFSERIGKKQPKQLVQLDSMDQELRNLLWNLVCHHYWDFIDARGVRQISFYADVQAFVQNIWSGLFKKPIDEINDTWTTVKRELKYYFMQCEWLDVYEFIEFMANQSFYGPINIKFMEDCNTILERELSGYRFINKQLTPISSKEESEVIQKALSMPNSLVNEHLNCALSLLSDKKNPDYRNSIKEAISAVESMASNITGKTKADLDDALKILEEKVGLHPALKRAFSALYGYASSSSGIRHALMESPSLNFEDAKFMLVSCSAFVNYLNSKNAIKMVPGTEEAG